jgi:neutral ceramidase
MNYACHATVLEHDNMLYSADFPGVAAALVEHAVGGRAIYMQGTCGDINPAWMRHDFEEVRRVGGIVGAAAARTALELRPLGEKQSVINLSWNEELPVEPAPGTIISDISLGAARTFLDLPRKQLPDLAEIEANIAEIEGKLAELAPDDVAGRRAIRPRLNELRIDRVTKQRFPATAGVTQRVEVQAFRISPQLAVAMLPGEFFVVTGRAIASRSPFEHTFVCAYANDYAGYFATAEQFPCAGYEVGSTRFQPEAEGRIVDAAVELLASLHQGGAS